ncbi:MAG: hypothetical protein KAT58_09635, partial [candidate division Zixibacteria bacterium]|nr:hypothetical protein [candidate division Zixibacteria bacterium]
MILVSTLGLLVLFLQLVNIQVLSHDHYFAMAEENRIRVTPIPPLRGRILDREGRLLASDRPSYTISIIPSEAKPLSELAGKLAPLLAMDADVIVEKVRQRRFRKYEPVRIKRDVDFGTVCIIEEAAELYPGVIYQLDHARHYHYGNIACHLLGHTGEVDDRERRSGYRLGSLIGRSGIERQYDQLLRGFEGVDYLEVSATGRIIGPLEEKQGREPIAGMELVLTIDLDLQRVADSLFGDTLTGAAVFIRPRSGEIVALVSKPTYDANLFSGLVPVSEYDNLIQDQGHPLFDRAI